MQTYGNWRDWWEARESFEKAFALESMLWAIRCIEYKGPTFLDTHREFIAQVQEASRSEKL